MAVDEVLRMSADAQAVVDALAAERLPAGAAVQSAHKRVQQLAHDLANAAKDPITIGIVGEFSVGKSMLLGTLLGQPALLPVEERATTGNITALTIQPAEMGQPTTVENAATVYFLSEDELAKCVGFMCDKLIAAAAESKFPAEATAALHGYNPVTDGEGWVKLESWCKKYLWPEGGRYRSYGPSLIATELLAVRDAHLSVEFAPNFLGQSARASDQVIKAALDLQPAEIRPDTFPVRNPRLGVDLAKVGDDSEALAKVFPLIRRVSYHVKVDPKVWGLESLRGIDGNSIVILDFPGVGSGRSGIRDEFLSRDQLKDVHTIVTVFNSAKPGTNSPQWFFSMLESHNRTPEEIYGYIIAVGNAFDRITPPQFPHDGPLTVEDLRPVQEFGDLWVFTSNLTQRREDRVRATSSIAAIIKHNYPTSGFSKDQQARIAGAAKGVTDRQAQWKRIGERITDGDPKSPWGQTLVAFGEDGGIASLRQLIESHIAEHGLVNKISDLRRRRALLVQAVGQLEALLPLEQVSDDETAAARLRVDQVSDEFRRHAALTKESADQFRDPMRLSQAGTGVIKDARRRCMAEVKAWPEWLTLLLRAGDDGLIVKSESASNSDDDEGIYDPLAGYADSNGGTVDTTEIFLERFSGSFDEVLSSARKQMTAAIADWASERNTALSALQATLLDPTLRELLTDGGRRLAAMGRGKADRILPLQTLADVTWANKILADVIRRGAVTGEQTTQRFPDQPSRYLPWHRLMPEHAGDIEQSLVRHPNYMFRMRREIASAMADAVAARLAQDVAVFRRQLLRTLDTGMEQIPDPGIVRLMFPDPAATEQDETAGTNAAGSPVRSLLRKWRAQGA
jgi:hypothetical protein